jgi:hypothetical protein
MAKTRSGIAAMIEAFGEQLITIDELRARMPEMRARETNLRNQIDALDAQQADREGYLALAHDLEGFLTQLRTSAETATVDERRRVVKLLVKDVLIGPEKITIRHRIPLRERTSGGDQSAADSDTEGEHCQLRWGRNHTALWSSGHLAPHLTIAHHPATQHRAQQPEHGLVANAFLNRLHQLLMRNRRKAVGDIRFHHPPTTSPRLVHEDLQGVVLTAFGPEPERTRQK